MSTSKSTSSTSLSPEDLETISFSIILTNENTKLSKLLSKHLINLFKTCLNSSSSSESESLKILSHLQKRLSDCVVSNKIDIKLPLLGLVELAAFEKIVDIEIFKLINYFLKVGFLYNHLDLCEREELLKVSKILLQQGGKSNCGCNTILNLSKNYRNYTTLNLFLLNLLNHNIENVQEITSLPILFYDFIIYDTIKNCSGLSSYSSSLFKNHFKAVEVIQIKDDQNDQNDMNDLDRPNVHGVQPPSTIENTEQKDLINFKLSLVKYIEKHFENIDEADAALFCLLGSHCAGGGSVVKNKSENNLSRLAKGVGGFLYG